MLNSHGKYIYVHKLQTLSSPLYIDTSGWLDQVYTQSHLEESGDSVQLHSPVGGSVILECQLNTTEEVTTSRLWLHRGAGGFVKVTPDSLHAVLPDGSLLVRNFNLLAGSSAEEYKCGVPFLNGEKKWREFTILKGMFAKAVCMHAHL